MENAHYQPTVINIIPFFPHFFFLPFFSSPKFFIIIIIITIFIVVAVIFFPTDFNVNLHCKHYAKLGLYFNFPEKRKGKRKEEKEEEK